MRKSKKKKYEVTSENFESMLLKSANEASSFVKGEIDLKESVMSLPEDPPDFSVSKIKKIRKKLEISQAIFARLLGVSIGTVRSWEQGDKHPSGPARRLLQIAEANVGYLLKIG